MSEREDIVQGWLLKAESDLSAVVALLSASTALDVVCYHAQQVAEKYLKAFLIAGDVGFPPTHNLQRLLVLCEEVDPTFASLTPLAEVLTPYAVEARYETTFWPSQERAEAAYEAALTVKKHVLDHLQRTTTE